MCANFKPLTLAQLQQLQLPVVGFSYADEVYPGGTMPLLFKSPQGFEWREVMFGLVPKWAEDTNIAKHTYNARHETIVRSASMLTMDAIDHPMMKDFHEPGDVKRSVIVIPHDRLDEWLSLETPDISSFIEGFPVEEFECLHVPKEKIIKPTPQLSMFE
ncbi:SOS response-associated peptidase family protein [Acinetobacter baumannii]|uniref:SOS response-associated peptidase family protein n=1 Tax=Acinetobacter baumannii TaxID=470 RepID=UPI00274114E0|nr:SOS response-associated peptidase family protein [Acinetobacter baumannii]MDP7805814.1 DUF159 family protein [Acinetobacter baumannii]MDP7860069.1 DUF159 family protein [Acinetobacter baumannii]MDP7878077.1 DUF159 family protein [Acinetobacter baumannii]